MQVDIVTRILFVIQDMQEGDALRGRFGPHTPHIQCHYWACNVTYSDLDATRQSCKYLYAAPMAMIAANADKLVRTRWSQHYLNNAFNAVCFADSSRGIFVATPLETMHAFRKGLIEYVTFSC